METTSREVFVYVGTPLNVLNKGVIICLVVSTLMETLLFIVYAKYIAKLLLYEDAINRKLMSLLLLFAHTHLRKIEMWWEKY